MDLKTLTKDMYVDAKLADVIPGRIYFAMASYKPERQYKHIDVGAGVDIDELLDTLESTDDF